MINQLNNVSYIICYRQSNSERFEALRFVVHQVRSYFPDIEILIVEQDAEPKLELAKDLAIKHVFIENSGLFNRSWAFNCAVKITDKDIFVFADADIFINKKEFLDCLIALDHFAAVTPNKVEITNVAIDHQNQNRVEVINKRKLYSFAGGMLFMTRSGFDDIGGWDERFEGWGGEDNAMSHLIYNQLSSKTFQLESFHIDHAHEFGLGNNHPKYDYNRSISEEVITRNGVALRRYIQQLKQSNLGDPNKYSIKDKEDSPKPLKFVLAITTYNRLEYLKICVESFLKTKSDLVSWQLIIADDNSNDGTKEFLRTIEDRHNAIIIHNQNTNIHHQVNSIIKVLAEMSFDLCFRCDDDIQFIQQGWENLYWETIQRTGYDHLIFYDTHWRPYNNLFRPISYGNLVSNCKSDEIQGALYTLTKDVLQEIGYFDEQQFGASGLGHVDFSFRCCRAGFNMLSNPFDVKSSNDFIRLQSVNDYKSATESKNKISSNSKYTAEEKKRLLTMDRIFIDQNENFLSNIGNSSQSKSEIKTSRNYKSRKYKKADDTFYSDRGFSGIVGFILKRIYNKSIDYKIYFIPNLIRKFGKTLNKISINLLNIEQ